MTHRISPHCALLVAFFGIAVLGPACADDQKPDAVVHFGGVDTAPKAVYFYDGAVVAVNRDLSKDGVLIQAYASHLNYTYANGNIPGTDFLGTSLQGDLMFGYGWHHPGMTVSAFVGLDVTDDKTSPIDSAAKVHGMRAGLKTSAELESVRSANQFYLNGSASYSAVWDSYWTRGRFGYDFGRVLIGGEGVASGSDSYKAKRLGAFGTFTLGSKTPFNVTMALGHQFGESGGDNSGSGPVITQGGSGLYWGVGFGSTF